MQRTNPLRPQARPIPLAVAAALAASAAAWAGSATYDFNSAPPADLNFVGNAEWRATGGVNNSGYMSLFDSINSQHSSLLIPDFDNGLIVKAFTFEVDLRVGNAVGNSGRPADGFSVSYARATDPVVADLKQEPPVDNLGNFAVSGGPENGTKTGIAVSFDTWSGNTLPDGADIEGIIVRVDNVTKARIPMPTRNGTCTDATSLQTGPWDGLDTGSPDGLCWAPLKVVLAEDGTLSVSWKNKAIVTNLATGFFPSAGRIVFAGRTGGANENTHIDNLKITTVAAEKALVSGVFADAGGVRVTLEDVGASVVKTNTVAVKLDGNALTPNSLTKSGLVTTFVYTSPTLLASGSSHTVEITFQDALNATITKTSSFSVPSYVLLPAALAIPDAGVDKTKPGFIWRVFANAAQQATSNARGEAALAGELMEADGVTPLPNLADPFAQGVAIAASANPNPANAPIQFEIAGVINLSQTENEANGNFGADQQMPGIPAIDGSTDGIAAEVLTYIELPAGITLMGVNSDDGFRTTAGEPRDAFNAYRLGEFEGGRGAADTLFYVAAEKAGVYAFRTLWEEGGGGANIEWFTVKSDGSKVLVNDTANGGLKAYRAATQPQPPYVKSVLPEPVPRQANGVSSALVIKLADGTPNAVNDNSIVLKYDGVAVTPTKKREGKMLTLTHATTGLQIPSEEHTAELTYKDSTGAYTRTLTWKFRNIKNLVLPTPKITENFNSYPEDSQPTGWVAWNYTARNDEGRDITSQRSESYENWVLVDVANVPSIDDQVLDLAPGMMFNGKEITQADLASGNVLYAESDSRSNTDALGRGYDGQTQFIISKPFDCSTFKGVVLTFSSLLRQNQDSLGAIEYSVDGGTNWLPVMYFLEVPDIKLNADGTVNAVATFNDPNTDTSSWVVNGVTKGDKYGDGIAAPITAALGDYCVPRINDDAVEGKRIEVARLAAAAGKSDVRLRLAAMGTDSWYYAIDNLAFYDVEDATVAPKFNALALAAGKITLAWTGGGTLQEATSVTGPWTDAADQTNPQSVTATSGIKFYRLKR